MLSISMSTPKISKVLNMAHKTILKMNKFPKKVCDNSSITYNTYAGSKTVSTPRAGLASQESDFPLSDVKYDLYRLNEGPTSASDLTKEEAIKYFKKMQCIRRMETLAKSLYLEKKIRGFCHLYIGEEACAVGLRSIMSPNDTVITSYRCHGWALLMGEKMENIVGELLGKTNGSARGKGGSMHIYGANFFGGNGIVGGHVPLGTGIALAHKYRNNGAISWTIYGDGASDQGQTFESYNMAKLWNLPVIYVIENNMYSMGTAVNRHSANPKYYTRGDIIPGIRVDGMDFFAIRDAGSFAIKHVQSGNGPIILQLDTYRYTGHSMSDPGTSYRTRSEIKKVQDTKDCIRNFVEKLISSQVVSKEEIEALENDVKKEIKTVLESCLKEKDPGLEETFCDVYADYKSKVKMPSMTTFKQHKNVSHLVKKEVSKKEVPKKEVPKKEVSKKEVPKKEVSKK